MSASTPLSTSTSASLSAGEIAELQHRCRTAEGLLELLMNARAGGNQALIDSVLDQLHAQALQNELNQPTGRAH